MAIVLARTRETVAAGGAGNITLGGAVSGAQAFSSAAGAGERFTYWIEDGTAWEYGIGYLDAAGNLVREVFGGSSTGAQLNVSTNAEVYSAPHPDASFGGHRGVYSEDGDGVGLLLDHVSRFTRGTDKPAVNTLYLVPFHWRGNMAISELGFDIITSPTANGTVYMGVYDITSAGEPGALVCEASIPITTTSIGIHTGTVASPKMVHDGFVGLLSTTDPTLRSNNSTQAVINGPMLGSVSDQPYGMIRAAITAPTGMPNPPPTSWTPMRLTIDRPDIFAMYGA